MQLLHRFDICLFLYESFMLIDLYSCLTPHKNTKYIKVLFFLFRLKSVYHELQIKFSFMVQQNDDWHEVLNWFVQSIT